MAEIENKIIKANKGDSLNELRYLIKYLRSYFLNMLDKVQPEPDYWYSELPQPKYFKIFRKNADVQISEILQKEYIDRPEYIRLPEQYRRQYIYFKKPGNEFKYRADGIYIKKSRLNKIKNIKTGWLTKNEYNFAVPNKNKDKYLYNSTKKSYIKK